MKNKLEKKTIGSGKSIFEENDASLQKTKALKALEKAKVLEAKKIAEGKKWHVSADGKTSILR